MSSLKRQAEGGSVRLESRRGGLLGSALFLGFFLTASLILTWMLALPLAIEWKLERDTGCDWAAERLACNPFGFELRVDEAIVGNSDRFGGNRPLMRIRSLTLQANAGSLLSERAIVDRVDLEISRMALILSEGGSLNLESFVSDLFGERLGFGQGVELRDCRLKVDTVEILDYSSPKPSHKALRLGIDEEGFRGEGAMALFAPLLEVARRAEYLPERFSRNGDAAISASRQ